jgi:hypothetical protein
MQNSLVSGTNNMNIVFLEGPLPLTKTYTKKADGSIEKSSYPNVTNFTSIEESCHDMKQFEVLLKKHAALAAESRKGSTDSNGPTDWIVFDLDGLPNAASIDQFLIALNLTDVSYVHQYSASYGIENKDLRAHVFMQLTKPLAAPLLKQWLIDMNHRIDMLRNAMKLTKTGNALSWPLDVTACQNDKLIYIAPPLLKGGIKDPMGTKPRIAYVPKRLSKLDITNTIPSTEVNREKTHKRVNELREKAGLPSRKHTYKMVGSNQILVKPDSATISDMKTDRGFVYFNLNGGDSWAYYHPENNPDFIQNFKGEPTYLTKELLPEYWEQLTQQTTKISSAGLMYLTFLDKKTSTYHRGTYNAAKDELELNQAKTETQVRHFAKQYGVPLGDFIPEWELIFDPLQKGPRVDVNAKRLNLYEPTKYMKTKLKKTSIVPPTIHKIIWHALGCDQPVYDHFMNWLACIFQYKTRTLTAWVLHGTEGTGKGVLMNKIIRPLLGTKQTASRHMEELNEPYNHWMANCFVAFIDEIEARALENERGVAAKLRNWITEPTISIRAMYAGSTEMDNHSNWIFASNKPEPVVLTAQDRRHNIAVYQPLRLPLSEKELGRIDGELQGFHDFMMSFKADKQLASKLIDTEDRRTMISISETSIDVAVSRMLAGDIEFFIDQLPSDDSYKRNALKANKVEDYKEVLLHLLDRTDPNTGACNISRDELHVLFGYTVGNVPETPNKFTSMLKHHRIHMTKVWVVPRAVQGIKATWAEPSRVAEYREMIAPTVTAKVTPINKKAANKK